MEITTGAPPTHPVLGLMGAVDSMLDDILGLPTWSCTNTDLAEAVELAHKLAGKFDAVRLRTIHDVDTHELASQAGATSTAAWLRHKLHLHPGAVGGDVKLAKALETNLQATGQALAAGQDLSPAREDHPRVDQPAPQRHQRRTQAGR